MVLYRVGDLVDASRGPMIANTGQLGRVSITAVHRIHDSVHRVQGVALPSAILVRQGTVLSAILVRQGTVQYWCTAGAV